MKIGGRIGRVVKIDKHTESMSRGKYIRLCIEFDITKPLMSKFWLNGRVWMVQYEGLRQICFKCGKLGHKDSSCTTFNQDMVPSPPVAGEGQQTTSQRPIQQVVMNNMVPGC